MDIITKTTCRQLDKAGRPDIFIKLECDQFGGSFKSRGVFSFLQQSPKKKGLVSFTTGNHGIAVAAIANKSNLAAIIVSSRQLSPYKRAIIENYGAAIQIIDIYNLDKAIAFAKQLASEKDYTFVPLFGDQHLLNGYSSIAEEICQDFNENLTMFFPVGSGSLLLANAKKARSLNPQNKIIGVEPKAFQRLNGSDNYNRLSTSIAGGLSIDRIPDCNSEMLNYTDEIMVIEEQEIVESIRIIHRLFGIAAEGAGAIALAAALKTKKDNCTKVAVITGKNISPEKATLLLNQISANATGNS